MSVEATSYNKKGKGLEKGTQPVPESTARPDLAGPDPAGPDPAGGGGGANGQRQRPNGDLVDLVEDESRGRIYDQVLSGLRSKWLYFIVLLLLYVTFLVFVVFQERDGSLVQLEEYQRIEIAEEALVKADLAAFHVVTALFVDLEEDDLNAIVQYFSLLARRYTELEKLFPEQADTFKQLVEVIPVVMDSPTRENLNLVHQKITLSKYELDKLMDLNRERRELLVADIKRRGDQMVNTTMLLGLVGLLLLGSVSGIFFGHLTSDIRKLQGRVTRIVEGYRGEALETDRHDELGQLITGVNDMAKALAEREQELEIERRRSSYQEKMTAIESLAGGIAHEINNPINCIEGLARLLMEDARDAGLPDAMVENIESIVSYSDGLTRVMRDLQAIATPSGAEYQLIDFNHLISHTIGLLQYSARQFNIRFDMQLETSLPAIYGIEDQLELVVSNIVENAFDALACDGISAPRITIETTLWDKQHMACRITDNGKGMSEETLSHMFEPFFTTKPIGSGTGLGLALCWSTISSHNGDISISSSPDEGTSVLILLPLPQAEATKAVNE